MNTTLHPNDTVHFKPHGFVAPEITPDQFVFGAHQLPEKVMREDGNWMDFLVKFERQSYHFDTFGCAVYNVLQPIEILQKRLTGKEFNYAERYPYIKLGIQPPGSNPHTNLEWIRKNGLIPEDMLPFHELVRTLEEYADKKLITQAMEDAAFQFVQEWKLGHEWVFNGGSVKEKHERMKAALRFSPLGVSVGNMIERNGIYYREEGGPDIHWTNVVTYHGDNPILVDSYEPFLKKLDKNFNFGYAKKYSVERLEAVPKPEKQVYLLELILERLKAMLKVYFPTTNI